LGGQLRLYARAIIPNAADDAVQRALCRMMTRSAAEIAAVKDPKAWLLTLVRREAINLLRTARRDTRARAPSSTPNTLPPDADHPDLADLLPALDRLPRVLREVVILRHATALTFEAIADHLGANQNTVAWRYTRALAFLRAALDPPSARPPSAAEVTYATR
jgi:RNA polymerase sigma factor (sigma-70 family)